LLLQHLDELLLRLMDLALNTPKPTWELDVGSNI
jgi:hypothetical protein